MGKELGKERERKGNKSSNIKIMGRRKGQDTSDYILMPHMLGSVD